LELILEIGTEEIPPSYIRPALVKLEAIFRKALDDAGIGCQKLRTLGTPRRLVVIARGMDEKAAEAKETVFGPPANKAFDESGKPTQAAEGFAKSQGVAAADLKTGKKGKGEYVCVEKVQEGAAAVDVIASALRSALDGGVPFPKMMKWEEEGRRFARPIRWLAFVADGKTARETSGEAFKWAGLEAANLTRGHRLLGKQDIKVSSSDKYLESLKKSFVIADHEERKQLIKELIDQAAASADGAIVEDEELLERVTFTVEYPLAVLGGFSEKFLEMPQEVVVTALREHQDFFSVCRADGTLMPSFVAVANTDKDRSGKIKSGNERVLKARLDDAHFYWEQDLKDGLDKMAGRLSHVVWQEQLGTLEEKAGRVAALAELLAELAKKAGAVADGADITGRLKRAAHLCKADLTSNMVREKEFSSLQGLMGMEYARHSGEDKEVAAAIFEHYLPRFAGDVLPDTMTGSLLAVADKLDSIVGCFGIGLIPTGSEDPYALRRQGTGLTRILIEKRLPLPLGEAIRQSIQLYGDRLGHFDETPADAIETFLKQRIQTVLMDAGNRPGIAEGVIEQNDLVPALIADKVEAVREFESDPRFETLVTVFKRAYNITTTQESGGSFDESLLKEKAEADLYGAYSKLKPEFDEFMAAREYGKAMELLLELAQPIDVFFTEVMVMVDDEALKLNRLSLLGTITGLFLKIADFSRVEAG
jgi:glycyl-tRNA synthetase beta chain